MTVPLESNFLVPNASLLVALLVVLAVLGLLVGSLIWLVVALTGRNRAVGS